VVETVNRRTVGARSKPNDLAMNHQVSSSTGSLSTDANRTFFNMAGNGQSLTLRTVDAVDGRAIFVRKYSSTGVLTVITEGAEQIALNGSTNANGTVTATRGGAWFVFDGTDWVCMPTDEAGAWALAS